MVGAGALSHLGPQQVAELMARYYAGEEIAQLLREFSITCHASKLVQSFPAEVLDLPCPNCGSQILRQRRSRARSSEMPAVCSGCEHRQSPWCRCPTCRSLAEKLQKAQSSRTAEAIVAYCESANRVEAPTTDFDEVSPIAAIALLALVRATDNQSDGRLSAVPEANPPFAPTPTLAADLLRLLHAEGLICLDPTSPPEAFSFEEDQIVGVQLLSAKWRILDPGVPILMDELVWRSTSDKLPTRWLDDARKLHINLAAAECRSFFDWCLKDRRLPAVASPKVDMMIRDVLIDYSVSQALKVIRTGAQWTSDFLLRGGVHRSHAANYAIGACQRFADQARAKDWEVRGLHRPPNLPRSVLGYVLHDLVLKVGDRGFYSPASLL